VLISECKELVHSSIGGNIPLDILHQIFAKSAHIASAENVLVTTIENFDNYVIEYLVPEFFPEYTLMRLRFLPFYNTDSNFCYRISDEPYIAGVGLNGEFFTYTHDQYTRHPTYAICSQDSIRLRTNPRTCEELLLTKADEILPAVCAKSIKVSTCKTQDYIYKNGAYYIFSPYNDTITYICQNTKGKFQIEKGLTKVNVSSCDLYLNDLVIKQMTIKPSIELLENNMELFHTLTNLNSIFADIEPFESIDLSKEKSLFKNFLQAREKVSVAIEAASLELEKFRHMEKLANFTLLNFDIDK
jgi:hypothetical protein